MTKNNDHIEKLEFAVYKRNHSLAFKCLLELLRLINTSGNSFNDSGYFNDKKMAQINATRIASGLVSLLSDTNFKLDWQKYIQLIVHKKDIISIFRVSGYCGSRSSLKYFLHRYEKTKNQKKDNSNLHKMLIIMGLEDHDSQTLTMLMNIDTKISTPYILSLLSSLVILSEKEHIVREKLLAFGSIINRQPIDFDITGIFAVAWMHCSYAVREDKHLFKGHLNIMMKQAMKNSGFKQPFVKRINHEIKKPKIVILAEILNSTHAMGRCYTNYIKQLKNEFETTLITSDDAVDEAVKALFDHTVLFSCEKQSIHEISLLITEQNPDIIYYPSIGMATWTVALLTYRFAPIQIMSPGHPATSVSDTIDYIICNELMIGDPSLYSERILIRKNPVNFKSSIKNEKTPKAKIRKNPKILRIAINSKSFKLNAIFLEACKHVNSTANREIEWLFFPNEIGLQYYHFCSEISQWLPNARVIKSLSYNDYLEELNQCDVAVGTIPFGGSNTNVDLIKLGIPKIFYTGKEMHSRADAVIFNNFKIPSWFSCDTINSWCDSVIRLVQDDNLRCQLSHSLLNQDPSQRIMDSKGNLSSDFLNAIKWVWWNHEKIIESDQRIITPEERLICSSEQTG